MIGKKKQETGEPVKIKYAMDEESAKAELARIDDFFDAEYGVDSDVVLEHIRKGLVYLDEDQDKVIYKLLSPIEKNTGDPITEIKLRPLLLKDIMEVGRKLSMKGNSKEEFEISITYDLERTYITLSKCGNLPLGLMDRLKKRDIKVLSEVLDFLQ